MCWSLGWNIMERKALEKDQRVQTLFASEKGKRLSKSIFRIKYILKQIIRYLKQMATESGTATATTTICRCPCWACTLPLPTKGHLWLNPPHLTTKHLVVTGWVMPQRVHNYKHISYILQNTFFLDVFSYLWINKVKLLCNCIAF